MIMPLRLDNEEVRGFLSIDGLYLDNRPPAEIDELILKRLNSLQPPLPSPRNRLPSPYRGLEAFRMEDERFFFGRKVMIRLLYDKIHLVETLAVVGASGVGKSSLIQAGLLPKLRDQGWLILAARLSDAPFLNLGLAMAENLNEPAAVLAATFEESPTRLLEDLRKVGHPDKYVVLYIDQFEEVFALLGPNRPGAASGRSVLSQRHLRQVAARAIENRRQLPVGVSRPCHASSEFEGDAREVRDSARR